MNALKRLRTPTARLTMWYLVILTVLSVFFSLIVYTIAAQELHRPLRPNQGNFVITDDADMLFERLRRDRESQSRGNLISNLIIFNITVITTGGLISYILARRTLEPIETALAAQTRFSSDAAHELRTPLSVMQSEIEVGLRQKNPSIKSQQSLLMSNLDEVNRLRALTDRLLLLTTDDTVPTQLISLDDVATEAVNRALPLALKKHIGIESTVGNDKANANADLLTDVLVILLDNAVKYSPQKSQVQISTKKQGRHILLQVKDQGHGITEKDLPHIFDRFYQADQSRSKAIVEGHGLGLSIAKRLVETMGGDITATSSPGHGTTFTIRLSAN